MSFAMAEPDDIATAAAIKAADKLEIFNMKWPSILRLP
jgi:hypothetical protein